MSTNGLLREVLLLTLTFSLSAAVGAIDGGRNLRVLYNTRVNLTCADDHFDPHGAADATFQWMLPTGKLVDLTSPPDPSTHLTLHENASSLIISSLDRPHFGVYTCLVRPHNANVVQHVVRWAVNVDGPYFGDLEAKFWAQGRVGLVAGIAVCVFMSMLCINLEQFDNNHTKRQSTTSADPAPQSSAVSLRQYFPAHNTAYTKGEGSAGPETFYTNPAFVDESVVTTDRPGEGEGETTEDDGQGRNHADAVENEPKTSF